MIERTFGVLKRRFPILNHAAEYSLDTQVYLVYALTGLHNSIKSRDGIDGFQDPDLPDLEEDESKETIITGGGSDLMDRLRDQIARDMWVDYRM